MKENEKIEPPYIRTGCWKTGKTLMDENGGNGPWPLLSLDAVCLNSAKCRAVGREYPSDPAAESSSSYKLTESPAENKTRCLQS